MTYEQYIQVMRDLYAAGFTTRINYKMYDDETQLPRMTPEEREKWNNLDWSCRLIRGASIDMAQLRNNARNRLQYKNENLIAEGKKPLSEEEYIDNGAYLYDEELVFGEGFKAMQKQFHYKDFDYEDIKDRIDHLKEAKEKYSEKGMIDTVRGIQDDYWKNFGRPTVSQEQVMAMKARVERLAGKGVDFEEYLATTYEKEYKEKKKIRTNPLQFVVLCAMGPKAEEAAMCRDIKEYEDANQLLNEIEEKLEASQAAEENDFDGPDIKGEALSIWFNTEIFGEKNAMDILDSTLNNRDVKPEERLSLFENVFGLNPEKMDPDKAQHFDKKLLQEASELYKANKAEFDKLFHDMYYHRNGVAPDKELKRMQKLKEEEPALYKKANRFRHLLYKISKQNDQTIKLGTDEKPIFVEPLPEQPDFTNPYQKNKELKILDTCYEMLEEPSTRVQRNSNEYQKIMRSIHNLQKNLENSDANKEELQKEYVRGLGKVMKNIKHYYMHKAQDGVSQDATLDKLKAVKRVENLLQSRYKTLEKKEYEMNLECIEDFFKTKPNRDKVGDDYVLDLAMGEIGNIRQEMKSLSKEKLQEIKRRNSMAEPSSKPKLNEEKKAEVKKAEEKNGPEQQKGLA